MALIYSAAAGVRSVVSSDGGVLLDLRRGVCFGLNPVGAYIWSLLSAGGEGLTREMVVNDLARRYATPRPALEEDIESFLSTLRRKGLAQTTEGNRDETRER